MVDRLRVVRGPASCPPSTRLDVDERWGAIAADTYRDLELDYCVDPELILDRLCLDVWEGDCTIAEVIGRIVFYPPIRNFEQHGLAMYRIASRVILLRLGISPDAGSVERTTHGLVLPRIVAKRVCIRELGDINPYVPVDYLRQIYMQHNRSGEMSAIQPTG